MSRVRELFTFSVKDTSVNWRAVVDGQQCRYSGKRCFKVRKSQPDVSIGTCTVAYGHEGRNIVICPLRLTERRQIFVDCLHLLEAHRPGNELHIVPEVAVPGGSVDYFLVSTDSDRNVEDFVGIGLQAMDTTGSLWPERERTLCGLGLKESIGGRDKPFGINWKMTAKTILVQLHHKIDTFEHLGKHLVLVLQDHLLEYIKGEFAFSNINPVPSKADSMHIHSYRLKRVGQDFRLVLDTRYSTDSRGVSALLGLNADANVSFGEVAKRLKTKISDATLFSIV